MIKIVFVHSVAKIGGAERVSQMLMAGLNKKEYTCELVCPAMGSLGVWAKEHDIKFTILPVNLLGLSNFLEGLKQVVRWIKFLKSSNIDMIHTADPYCVRAVSIAAKICAVKVIAHYHFPFESDTLRWLMYRFPKPNCAVFCSQNLHLDIGPKIQAISSHIKLITIHNGVDVEKFQPSPQQSKTTINIAIIANLQKRKGHDEFIAMAAILKAKYDNLCFHIIGGDILEEPREDLLKNMVADLDLSHLFTFHGQVSNVLSKINEMDIIVCASHQEAFPIAILEAMAMQKPIVSTNVNGIPEAIIDNESGLLVDPHSPQQLASATSKLIESPSLRSQLAGHARSRVQQNFNSELFIRRFEAMYEALIYGG
jgi:glycosyltransferase involved in cell wall biosynthesis